MLGGVRAVFRVARARGVVGDASVGVEAVVPGDNRPEDTGVLGTVRVCVGVGCVSSISANLLSGAVAARVDLSRENKLRRLLLDDCRLTGD